LDGPGIEIAGGFGPLAGKVFRIGVMGPLATEENVQFFLKEFKKILSAEAIRSDPGIFLSVWRTAQDNRSIRPIIQGPALEARNE